MKAYIEAAAKKSDLDRTDLAKDKSGVFTGSYCLNPVNGEKIPVWVADYVLISYGTGAIMAVPAHDERDFEFAEKYSIPIQRVIAPSDDNEEKAKLPYSGPGVMVNSGEYDGMDAEQCKSKIISELETKGQGKGAVNYKLRDWIFSRQRYWGEPIPLVWVSLEDFEKAQVTEGILRNLLPSDPVTSEQDGTVLYALPLPSSELPLKLPEVENYQPAGTGESPLATITDWLEIWFDLESGKSISRTEPKPEGEKLGARHPRDQHHATMGRFLLVSPPLPGSKNSESLVDPKKEAYWGGPDFYIGGAEHAVLHLLYARFWHRFLHDESVLAHPEPYEKLFHQGLILGEDGNKMSKSVGNVVNPDVVIDAYGADSLRLFEMFLGPPGGSQALERKRD